MRGNSVLTARAIEAAVSPYLGPGRTLADVEAILEAAGAPGTPLALVPAAAQLPTLGDSSDMSTVTERKLGERIARELYRDPDYIDDPVLVEYVQGIWQPLLVAARARGELTSELDERFAWQVLLGKDRSINAFALPGGWLGLYLGLISVTTSRDEVASVLAHELTHVTQRHISRLVSQESRNAPLVLDRPDTPHRLLGSEPMVTLGRWSYGLFIWHLAALAMVFPVSYAFTPPSPTAGWITSISESRNFWKSAAEKLSGLANHLSCCGKLSVSTLSMSITVARCTSAMHRAE